MGARPHPGRASGLGEPSGVVRRLRNAADDRRLRAADGEVTVAGLVVAVPAAILVSSRDSSRDPDAETRTLIVPGGQAMEFRILGPLEAADGATPARLTGGRQRALLALLLIHADRVVAIDRLVDDLWGEQVPETAQKMVQVYVSRLRKQLPPGVLRTLPPGYLVDLDGHSLDLRRFEQLEEQGRAALAQGRAEEAAHRLREALALWRGPALAEFEEPFAPLESSRLEEQRLACLEERIEADLALARHSELVGELDALVGRHRHRERLRGQLMLALYRSGRQAEALESYQSFRRMLGDELGIEPSTRLKDLHRRMLQQDPSLDPAAGSSHAVRRLTAGGEASPRPEADVSLHGRQRELDRLAQVFAGALAGERQLAFVTGDAGIGKTTIVESFLAQNLDRAATARGQCVEHHGAAEPYLAILEALTRLCRQEEGRDLVPLLARQAPMWLAQMPWLLGDDELEAVQRRVVGATQARMLREMLEALEEISAATPLLLVLEDLHWSDPSTIDLLDALARRTERARLLVLGTYRRSDAVALQHPVFQLARSLRSRGLCVEIAVGPLGRGAVEDYVTERVDAEVALQVADVLHERTGGNPLFASILLDSWLEHGLLAERRLDLAQLERGVPHTVRQLIEQAFDQLDPADRDLLGAASVVGQEFPTAAVAAATGRQEIDVDVRCEALARSGHFLVPAGEERWPDGTVSARYRFAHDLHREVLYDGLPAALRAQAHGRVGRRLGNAYRGHSKEIAATAAEHFMLAGDARRAVTSFRLAAEQAFERLAHREAVEHLTKGLEMLERLPEDPKRWSEEIALQSMLGAAEVAAQGWSAAEAEAALLRGRELAERIEDGEELGWALFRLGSLYEVRGEYERSEGLLEQALALSGPTTSAGLLADSHARLACSLFHQGVFARALEHAELGLVAHDGEYFNPVTAAYGDNAGVACHSWAALSLWFLGFPDRARDRALEAVALADDPRRRHGYATALAQAAIVEQLRLDVEATGAHAEAAIEAATRDGYRYRLAMAAILHGWSLAAGESPEEGIAELEQGLELSRETGAHMDDPYYLALLADASARTGRIDTAAASVEEAFRLAPPGRGFFFESELHRLTGEVLLRLGRGDEAEVPLRQALELARDRGSPSLELRAALSLAGCLHANGQAGTARTLVRRVYSTFTEGFETHDLVAARRLLA
jgi:DNA-binding SARP family transcriptional activator